ncbi:MAG TPA: pyruvate kinase [Rickettsiales bacterium]|nr:pyruvate kinase [Rickettsiales bacterium]
MQINKVKRLTKIISSIGPATDGINYFKVFNKGDGANFFRYNFSHDRSDIQGARLKEACKQEKESGLRVSKFADMQGPKHRIGLFKDGKAFIEEGQKFILDLSDELGDNTRVKLPHPEIFSSLIKGAIVLINDGQLKLEVVKPGDEKIETKVLVGGKISDKKGFNIPNVLIKSSCITEKDKIDIEDALNVGFKIIVISFVQTPEDILEAKKIINNRAKIISKLEKPMVMQHLEKIIELSDGIMIGRGDFAVEASYEIVPVYERKIIEECNKQNKPVIVATQMLETMIENPFPTRAEISDIATACYNCADCVMLSAETTVGKNPELVIDIMSRVLKTVEAEENRSILDKYIDFNKQFTNINSKLYNEVLHAVEDGAKALYLIEPNIEVVGQISKMRLRIPFFPFFKDEQLEQICRLYYGCDPVLIENKISDEEIKKYIAKRQEITEKEVYKIN